MAEVIAMLNFKKKVWIVRQKEKGVLTDYEIASIQHISRMTVYRLWDRYCNFGVEALKEKPIGRKVDEIPNKIQEDILRLRKEDYGIHAIEGMLKNKNIIISHNKIHRFLRSKGLVKLEPKKGRRYNYIRWERKHSNSLWQTDFCWDSKQDCWLTAWLDDHSRLITAAEYITEATTDASLEVFEKGVKRYGLPKETLSDRGSQYYANLGETCRFLEYMKSKGINHIYASIKKPTTCGKLERWWRTHNDERWNFTSLSKFVNYYNYKRPHMSLDYLTPHEVYVRDLRV